MKNQGFAFVEFFIVLVILAILAAIIHSSYYEIKTRNKISSNHESYMQLRYKTWVKCSGVDITFDEWSTLSQHEQEIVLGRNRKLNDLPENIDADTVNLR